MTWDLNEAIGYYQKHGAPKDQTALVNLLREVQQENGGGIPEWVLEPIAVSYGLKETFLQALIRRYPSLRLAETHTLELCAGPNCGRNTALAAAAEKLRERGIAVKFIPCMRHCGEGPNFKWDGRLYHKADMALLKKLAEE